MKWNETKKRERKREGERREREREKSNKNDTELTSESTFDNKFCDDTLYNCILICMIIQIG